MDLLSHDCHFANLYVPCTTWDDAGKGATHGMMRRGLIVRLDQDGLLFLEELGPSETVVDRLKVDAR